MNTKQILIRIRTEFEKQGVQLAQQTIKNFASNITAGFRGVAGGVLSAINPLNLFSTIFGRVTLGMLTWQAWRTVVQGFREIADAVVGANARMQSARQMFIALSGGSEEFGQMYIDILRQLSIQTGVSFDQLVENAKRLPTQVGQNFEAFANLTKKAVVLGMLDPVQGVNGAMIALTNFMEGTAAGARSLVQRFELFNLGQVKRALEETATPLEALDRLFKEAGIDVDGLTGRLKNTLPVAWQGVINIAKEFLRVLGEPIITQVTEDLVKLRDWLVENQAAITGLAQALGEGASNAFTRFKSFIADLLGIDELDPGAWFDAGVELMTNFASGLFEGLNWVLDAVTQIASTIASFFIGASPPPAGPLSAIREGGQETIKQYVEGMIDGLSSDTLKGLAKSISDNLIGLESQELAQEKSIANLEHWVDRAASVVQAARDRLQLFDLAVQDIPERFTRGRRRQLELEIMSAEAEERRRKEALNLAKEQLKATKEYLQAQKQVLSLLERQAKAAEKVEEEQAKGIDRGFTPAAGFDLEKFKQDVAKWKDVFKGKLQPLFDELKGDFAETWGNIEKLADKIGDVISGIKQLGTNLKTFWDNLPPGVQDFLKVVLPALLLGSGKSIALGIALEMAGDSKGLLLILAGVGGPVVVRLALEAVGALAKNLLPLLLSAAPGIAASPLLLPVTILILEIILGREELSKWISGQRPRELKAIISVLGFRGAEEEVQKGLAGKISELTGAGITTRDIKNLFQPGGLLNIVSKIGESWGKQLIGSSKETVAGGASEMEQATQEGVQEPVVGVFQKIYDSIVGRSIVPDLLHRVVQLFGELPGRLVSPLVALYNILHQAMNVISSDWNAQWGEMVSTAVNSLMVVARTYAMAQQLSLATANLPRAGTTAISPANAQNMVDRIRSNIPTLGGSRNMNVNLQLDAGETQRLMQEGTYQGIIDISQHLPQGT